MELVRARSVSMFTLGAQDLARSVAFYEALGFIHSPDSNSAMHRVSGNISHGINRD